MNVPASVCYFHIFLPGKRRTKQWMKENAKCHEHHRTLAVHSPYFLLWIWKESAITKMYNKLGSSSCE